MSIPSDKYLSIPSDKYYKAIDLVNDATDKFNKIISGTDNTPTCLLVTNHENDQAQKDSAKTAKKATPEHASAPAPDNNKKPPMDNFFLWFKEGKMPHSPEADKTKHVCLMHVRKGLICSNPHCPMIHSSPSEWPASTLKAWIKVIHEMDGLLFNDATVPHDIVARSLNIS